jgi:uncharacterized protein YbbC (DUF1343 family)
MMTRSFFGVFLCGGREVIGECDVFLVDVAAVGNRHGVRITRSVEQIIQRIKLHPELACRLIFIASA